MRPAADLSQKHIPCTLCRVVSRFTRNPSSDAVGSNIKLWSTGRTAQTSCHTIKVTGHVQASQRPGSGRTSISPVSTACSGSCIKPYDEGPATTTSCLVTTSRSAGPTITLKSARSGSFCHIFELMSCVVLGLDPKLLDSCQGTGVSSEATCMSIVLVTCLFNLIAAQQQGIRGGLERLGANTDTLAQMQALSHNLAKHRTLTHPPADGQQPPNMEAPASLPAAPTAKGPRLPLRPKPHHIKQGSAVQHTPASVMPQGAAPIPKQPPTLPGNTHIGQENSCQPWHTHAAGSPQASPSTSAHASTTLTATQEAGDADRSRTWLNQHLHVSPQQRAVQASTAHAPVSRDFNALATPRQLAAGLQQAVLGQPQAASDAVAEQHDAPLPVSYSNQSPNHLGESSAPGQATVIAAAAAAPLVYCASTHCRIATVVLQLNKH